MQFQNSDFATYRAAGQPVFDVFFAAVEADGEVSLYGFKTATDRDIRLPGFARSGYAAHSVSHREAYAMIRGGTRAFYHVGDVPAEEVWTPLQINSPVAKAA
jgi:hypothetical protein